MTTTITNRKILLQLFSAHRFRVRHQRPLQSGRRAPPPPPRRNLYSAVAVIACWIKCPVSTALSYGKGEVDDRTYDPLLR